MTLKELKKIFREKTLPRVNKSKTLLDDEDKAIILELYQLIDYARLIMARETDLHGQTINDDNKEEWGKRMMANAKSYDSIVNGELEINLGGKK